MIDPRLLQQLLLMALDPRTIDGESANACRQVRTYIKVNGIDVHDLVQAIASPPFSDDEKDELWDTAWKGGYQQRIDDEVKARLKGEAALAKLAATDPNGVNGYTWHQIMAHCAAHIDRLNPGFEQNFIEDNATKFALGFQVYLSPKQQDIVRRIFKRYFNNRI